MFFIPFDKHKSIGGPATFLRNLKVDMDKAGYLCRERYKKGDSIFFPISYNLRMLKKVKKYNGRIVQRLDGVYEPSAKNYKKRFERMHSVYHNYADCVVFQSNFCRLLCRERLGDRNSKADVVIHNGVDPDIFFPCERPLAIEQPIEFVTTGNFRSLIMLKPILDALESLQNKLSFRLHICGPVREELTSLLDKKYVVIHGRQTLHGVAELLRKSHIFLFSNINPPCPNSVLEAIASGLPVVSFNSGSLSELLPFSEELLAYVSSDCIQSANDIHYELLADKIYLAVQHFPRFQENARAHTSDVAFPKCGEAYRKVFSSAEGIR